MQAGCTGIGANLQSLQVALSDLILEIRYLLALARQQKVDLHKISILALAVVSALLWKNSHSMTTTGVGLALILGGAVGNLWDRLLTGRVVDFLDFYLGSYHWPAFNVADSAIVIGALLLVAEILFARSPAEQKAVR